MQVSEIKKGSIITIVAIFQNQKLTFDSEVKLVSGNTILVPTINYDQKTAGFNENFMVDIHYTNTEDGQLYRFPDAQLSLVRYGSALFHKISIEHEGAVYNRRGDYRLYIGKDMKISVDKEHYTEALTVMLKDISLSGFAFVSKETYEIGNNVYLKYRDEKFYIELPGNIVRSNFNEHLNANIYGCTIAESFPKLGEYLIVKQREILKKTRSTHKPPVANSTKNKKET